MFQSSWGRANLFISVIETRFELTVYLMVWFVRINNIALKITPKVKVGFYKQISIVDPGNYKCYHNHK